VIFVAVSDPAQVRELLSIATDLGYDASRTVRPAVQKGYSVPDDVAEFLTAPAPRKSRSRSKEAP
jgi:hypothetical protein